MRTKSATVNQIKRLDHIAIHKYGVPSLALMENAGRSVAMETLKTLKKKNKIPLACIFCGLGNNAGDGFVAARHLVNAGVKIKIYIIGSPDKFKNDAAANYKILKKLRYPIAVVKKINAAVKKDMAQADVLIDALFGVGLSRDIGEPFQSIIDHLNIYSKNIIAVDVPSGLDGTTGQIYNVCVKAKRTVTFSLAKKGFFLKEGPRHTGKVVVVDIGIPGKLMKVL